MNEPVTKTEHIAPALKTAWEVGSPARDIAAIQLARQDFKEGKGKNVRTAFAELRTELLALKARRDRAK